MKPASIAAVLLAAGTLTCAAAAQKPARVIRYRQSLMTVIGWNFGPLAAMVKGRTTWDAQEFARRSGHLAELAPQLLEGFAPGSDQGAETDAKADIWTHFDDFRAKADELTRQTRALADIAAGGDKIKMTEQFRHTAQACKACHDKYKAD